MLLYMVWRYPDCEGVFEGLVGAINGNYGVPGAVSNFSRVSPLVHGDSFSTSPSRSLTTALQPPHLSRSLQSLCQWRAVTSRIAPCNDRSVQLPHISIWSDQICNSLTLISSTAAPSQAFGALFPGEIPSRPPNVILPAEDRAMILSGRQ